MVLPSHFWSPCLSRNTSDIALRIVWSNVASDGVSPLPIPTWQEQREQCKLNLPRRAPSSQAQPSAFKRLQEGVDGFYGCSRPPSREPGVPLTLLHPVFGKFVDDAKTISPTSEDYSTARDVKRIMCNFHASEGARRHSLCQILREYGIAIYPGPVGSSENKTDGHVCTTTHPNFILELKNEIGSGGVEPSLQALVYYRVFCDEYELWDDYSTCHPCFIGFLMGQSEIYSLASSFALILR